MDPADPITVARELRRISDKTREHALEVCRKSRQLIDQAHRWRERGQEVTEQAGRPRKGKPR